MTNELPLLVPLIALVSCAVLPVAFLFGLVHLTRRLAGGGGGRAQAEPRSKTLAVKRGRLPYFVMFVVFVSLMTALYSVLPWNDTSDFFVVLMRELVLVTAVLVIVMLLSWRGRMMLRNVWWLAKHVSERSDFRAAGRAAGLKGEIVRWPGHVLWVDAADTEHVAEAVRRIGDAVELIFNDLGVGVGANRTSARPLRVIWFDDAAAYRSYAGANARDLGGFYTPLFGGRVVVNADRALGLLDRAESVLGHELAHHVTKRFLGRLPPPWIAEGLAAHCELELFTLQSAPGARSRRIRALAGRGALRSGSELANVSYFDVSSGFGAAARGDVQQLALIYGLYLQSGALIGTLRDCHAEELHALLVAQSRRSLFRKASYGSQDLGIDLDAIESGWREEILSGPLPGHETPPDSATAAYLTMLSGVAIDQSESLPRRRAALSMILGMGYASPCNQLIEGLRQSDDPLRGEIVFTLESISGEHHGTSEGEWRDWLDQIERSDPDV